MNNIKQIKHVFLDVVNFTKERTIETQTIIISSLNSIIKNSITEVLPNAVIDENIILIPTGDGICISIVNIHDPYDVEILLASKILELIHIYNKKENNDTTRYSIRIGIAANYDNVITDINNRKNIAGHGINMASRIMDSSDENVILISESLHDVLNNRDKYFRKFIKYSFNIKHGYTISCYKY